MIGKHAAVLCPRELLVAEKQCAKAVMNSPLSSPLKAAIAIDRLEASRCEPVSHRYNERVLIFLIDAAKWVWFIPIRVVPRELTLSSLAGML